LARDPDFIDRIEDDEEEMYRSYINPPNPWAAKIFFWLTAIGGIAVGICLFLFFITLFIYVFLPLAAIFFIWFSIKKWQWNRQWKNVSKRFDDE
jgi:hypothetical protein